MPEGKPPYVKEVLTSQANLYAFLGSLAAAALLSIPFGFGVGAVPLIAFAAGEVLAALHIPSLPTFREKVDRLWRAKARQASREQLIAELQKRAAKREGFSMRLRTYQRMLERVGALYQRAETGLSRLAHRDVEQLDDATVEYLGLWLSALVIDDRVDSINLREVDAKLAGIVKELAAPRPGTDIRQLQKARTDYAALIERHNRMQSRRRALEAAMLSMPDQLDEIYQTIMTLPASEDVGNRLEEAVGKLRLQEDIEADLASGLADVLPGVAMPSTTSGARRLVAVAGAGKG
ncbi:conserved exported hypothetical protein [Candidatus Accumulibacter aalborgensis]|uniref:Transmembrane protein n=1 Tax=Candidatus Accumulibacter aalborgensis TaxID=1860102 RepID=A0A1A8XXN8_9PROT|nr:hypothetical protein [Candidatus Accumulibacter aalborgensis]SBT08808.1 conserved exported hypothetical protein [Candidatus Accumulibacter aalborgensis]